MLLGYYSIKESSQAPPQAVSVASLGDDVASLMGGMPMASTSDAGGASTDSTGKLAKTLDKVTDPL